MTLGVGGAATRARAPGAYRREVHRIVRASGEDGGGRRGGSVARDGWILSGGGSRAGRASEGAGRPWHSEASSVGGAEIRVRAADEDRTATAPDDGPHGARRGRLGQGRSGRGTVRGT